MEQNQTISKKLTRHYGFLFIAKRHFNNIMRSILLAEKEPDVTEILASWDKGYGAWRMFGLCDIPEHETLADDYNELFITLFKIQEHSDKIFELTFNATEKEILEARKEAEFEYKKLIETI
ncbi:hypothetical protein [Peribacillus muralis]|uniref:hypothetical protein n=1 Tax=Peribacillus muralis TaxID=264697 RepID=UPI00366CB41C